MEFNQPNNILRNYVIPSTADDQKKMSFISRVKPPHAATASKLNKMAE